MMVSMGMVIYALTLMSVVTVFIFAVNMPVVLTSLVLTAVPAEKVTQEMDDIVVTLMNANMD